MHVGVDLMTLLLRGSHLLTRAATTLPPPRLPPWQREQVEPTLRDAVAQMGRGILTGAQRGPTCALR